MSEYLIPHPNVPTTDIGSAKLKESVMLFNENFLALDGQAQANASAITTLDSSKAAADHNHDSDYSKLGHTHSMQEVDSLVSNLELKAPLVHTHDQYLTSMPSHTHEESEVNNLISDLAQKADASHTHNMDEVTGLESELAQKATQSQLYQVASMIPNAASRGSSSTEGTIPKDIEKKPENETTAQKNARVGSSTEYARADHVHVFSSTMDASPVDDELYPEEEDEPYPEEFEFTEWEAGNDDDKGLKLSAYVMLSDYSGSDRLLMPIVISITKDGFVSSVKKSTGDHCVMVPW